MIPIFFGSLSAEQWPHAHEGLPAFRVVQTRYSDQAMCHERTLAVLCNCARAGKLIRGADCRLGCILADCNCRKI